MLHVHLFQQHYLSGKIFYKPSTEPNIALTFTFTFTFNKPLWILLEAGSSDLTTELSLGCVREVGGRILLAQTLLLCRVPDDQIYGYPKAQLPLILDAYCFVTTANKQHTSWDSA